MEIHDMLGIVSALEVKQWTGETQEEMEILEWNTGMHFHYPYLSDRETKCWKNLSKSYKLQATISIITNWAIVQTFQTFLMVKLNLILLPELLNQNLHFQKLPSDLCVH